jgi:hypothetical protein
LLDILFARIGGDPVAVGRRLLPGRGGLLRISLVRIDGGDLRGRGAAERQRSRGGEFHQADAEHTPIPLTHYRTRLMRLELSLQ